MCIRDSFKARENILKIHAVGKPFDDDVRWEAVARRTVGFCLLYTSDAADERSSVDLGGCRIIKKKTSSTLECARVLLTKNNTDREMSEH